MKKKWFLFLMIFLVICSVTYRETGHTNNEEALFTAFSQSNFQTVQTNIHIFGKISDEIMSLQEMEDMSLEIGKDLGIDTNWHMDYEESANTKAVARIKISKNAKTTIKIESIFSLDQSTVETYGIVDVIVYNESSNIIILKDRIRKALESKGMETTTYMIMTGVYNGSLDLEQKREIVADMMKNLKAKYYEDYYSEQVYSVLGYTQKMSDWILAGENKVNVNLALRYNSYENKTYLYLASPIITIEY